MEQRKLGSHKLPWDPSVLSAPQFPHLALLQETRDLSQSRRWDDPQLLMSLDGQEVIPPDSSLVRPGAQAAALSVALTLTWSLLVTS